MADRKDMIQEITDVAATELMETVADIKTEGYRLGQACATKTPKGLEVLYSFDKDNVLKNIRITLDAQRPELQSITAIFWPAFIYENEMHDLFGIKFKNMAMDYGGHFFKIAEKTPWNPDAISEAEIRDIPAGVEISLVDGQNADADAAAVGAQTVSAEAAGSPGAANVSAESIGMAACTTDQEGSKD
jgi:ech hydrogenase subunit D